MLPPRRAASSMIPHTVASNTPITAKSAAVQFTSLVNFIATNGAVRSSAAPPQTSQVQRLEPPALIACPLVAIPVSPCMTMLLRVPETAMKGMSKG